MGSDDDTAGHCTQLFLRLTALGEGSNDTRRRASLREVYFAGVDPDQVHHVIQASLGPKLVSFLPTKKRWKLHMRL